MWYKRVWYLTMPGMPKKGLHELFFFSKIMYASGVTVYDFFSMTSCIFCKIVAKDVPNHTVYEDDAVLAFLDIFPHAKGHTVVIPKKHAETITDLHEPAAMSLMVGVQKTVERIQTVLLPDGFNIGWNHGKSGGQAVPHLHVHILPRWNGDNGGSMHSIIKNPGVESVDAIAAQFRS